MQKLINKVLRFVLSEQKIWNLKNRSNIPSMEWSLLNIKKLGFDPQFAIDVGAFDGEWTKMFKKIFPGSRILMLEAQQSKEKQLIDVASKLPSVDFHIGLLGAQRGKEVTFHVNSTVSSVLEEYKENQFARETRKLETLDDIIFSKKDVVMPDFIKLDVQGYELEVLKGSDKVLKNMQFVLCEISLIEINRGSPLLADVIKFMDEKGFSSYDICSFIRRPLDKALWQTDILFVRKTHPIIQSKNWN